MPPRRTTPGAPETLSDAPLPRARHRRLVGACRTLAWIAVVAVAATMASERVYWYWAGIDTESVAVLAAYYSVAVAVTLFALASTGARSWRGIVAAGALFGLVVEGVLTPVVYEDGPLPLLFFLFIWWHGILAFGGFVVAVRRWALHRRLGRLTIASVVVGAYWGAWALVSAVSDRETAAASAADGGSSEVLDPASFATYAGWVGVVLIGSHLALGRLWPDRAWRPTRTGWLALGVVTLGLAATTVVPVVPWAPVKFGVLAWVLWRVIRQQRPPVDGPTVIDDLAGRTSLRHLLPVAAVPTVAAAVYAALWPLRDAPSIPSVFWALTAQQVLVGAAAFVWLLGPSIRRARPDDRPSMARAIDLPFRPDARGPHDPSPRP